MSRVYILCVLLGYLWRTDARDYSNDMWTDQTLESSPVTLTNLYISPNPVTMPGQIFFTIEGYSTDTLNSSKMILEIKRKTFIVDIPIPCILNIGSCTYDDMCRMVDDMIDQNWAGFTRQFGTNIKTMLEDNGLSVGVCPQPPRQISIINYPLTLPTMPSALTWFASGMYEARVRVIDNQTGKELVRFDLQVEVQRPRGRSLTGYFSSWFGGK